MCGTPHCGANSKNNQENSMRKAICRLMGMCFLAASLAAVAQSGDAMKQDTMQQGDQMKHDNMSADNMTKKSVSVSGKVSDDGKMFMSDKDNKNWMISNPEAVKGHEGHHVTVKAHVDAAKNEIHVTSVKMGKDEMKGTMNQDTMKKNEMQH
jgi:pentapeptide MXKDX repeat protein